MTIARGAGRTFIHVYSTGSIMAANHQAKPTVVHKTGNSLAGDTQTFQY